MAENGNKTDRKTSSGKRGRPRNTIENGSDGYYVSDRSGRKRLSTFLFTPTRIIRASHNSNEGFRTEDAIIGTINYEGGEFELTLSRSAFTSVRAFDREIGSLEIQWLSSDHYLRLTLLHILNEARAAGVPETHGTDTVGVTKLKGEPYFVSNGYTLSANKIFRPEDAPITIIETGRESPKTIFPELPTIAESKKMFKKFLSISLPRIVWTLNGWYAATAVKLRLREELDVKFPILQLSGTRGTGKTSMIQRIMLPRFGQFDPKPYESGTTQFVILAILGSSNTLPVAFAEFRYSSVADFIRFILMSYDTGHNPRGRADQTTVDYALSAPFSVDGEDLIVDPAGLERMNIIVMDPYVTLEGTKYYEAFKAFTNEYSQKELANHFPKFMQFCLTVDLEPVWKSAQDDLQEFIPNPLPDRIRNNHTVNLLGNYLWCDYLGISRPEPTYLLESIQACYDIIHGHGATLVDSFIESVVNSSTTTLSAFNYHVEADKKTFWFQMRTAHDWWASASAGHVLEIRAIITQLSEAKYYVGHRKIDGIYMYGIDLEIAQGLGLDIPDKL